MIRAFFAVFLGSEIEDRYARLHAECLRALPGLRWVHPRNLHLTVRFLGDTEEGLIDPLRAEVEVLAGLEPFRLTLGEPGAFGGHGRPRTLWFGVAEGAREMAAVAGRVEAAARKLGLPRDDKPWSPHVTVARNPRGRPAEGWEGTLARSGLPGLGLRVENIAFVSSTLQPGGPIYTAMWNARLGRGAEKATSTD